MPWFDWNPLFSLRRVNPALVIIDKQNIFGRRILCVTQVLVCTLPVNVFDIGK